MKWIKSGFEEGAGITIKNPKYKKNRGLRTAKRNNKQDLPTPESPIKTSLKR
jgi:hypothetical protein